VLSALGQFEEALAACKEAADIKRALAKDRPDAFVPDLARSLGQLSRILVATGRHAEAIHAAREGLEVIAPFAERLPHVFGDLADAVRRGYTEACEAGGRAPETGLLQRAAPTLSPRRGPPPALKVALTVLLLAVALALAAVALHIDLGGLLRSLTPASAGHFREATGRGDAVLAKPIYNGEFGHERDKNASRGIGVRSTYAGSLLGTG